jgi:hypothetical protein
VSERSSGTSPRVASTRSDGLAAGTPSGRVAGDRSVVGAVDPRVLDAGVLDAGPLDAGPLDGGALLGSKCRARGEAVFVAVFFFATGLLEVAVADDAFTFETFAFFGDEVFPFASAVFFVAAFAADAFFFELEGFAMAFFAADFFGAAAGGFFAAAFFVFFFAPEAELEPELELEAFFFTAGFFESPRPAIRST